MKAVLRDGKPWTRDASADAVPWREVSPLRSPTSEPLRAGLLPEDPELPWHQPVKRALAKAAAALAAAGHILIPISQTPETSSLSAWELALKFFSLDPSNTSIQHILDGGEPMINTVKIGHDHAIALGVLVKDSILELAAMNVERAKFQDAWREIWFANQLDVLIGPGAQHTAVKHDTYGLPGYTTIWNVLDYPAFLVPYSTASMELDPDSDAYPSTAPPPSYDPAAFDGAPCAIQVVAPRFMDEECLRATKIINEALNG